MSKEDVVSLIVYLLILAIAAIVGFAVIKPSLDGVSTIAGMSTAGFLILSFIISFILQVLLLEVGHVIGAKIGKYKILSFNILGFCFYKTFDNETKKYRIKFKFPKVFDGLTGETLVAPNSEKSNPIPFVWTPLFIYAIEVAILVLVYCFVPDKIKNQQNPLIFIKYFQVILVTLGGMLYIYNYFPAKLDSTTDGYRLICLSKKINVEAYNELLKIETDYYLGNDVENYKTFETITDFTALVNLATIRNYLKHENYNSAMPLLDKIIDNKNKVSTETLCKTKVCKLNTLMLSNKEKEAQTLYESFDSKEKDFLKRDHSMLTIRTAILYYGILEKSDMEVKQQLSFVKKALERETEFNKKNEKEILEKTIKILNERNPEIKVDNLWFMILLLN